MLQSTNLFKHYISRKNWLASLLLVSACLAQSFTSPTGEAAEYGYAPVAGTMTSPFGWRSDPMHGNSRFHGGIDIAAPTGSPVYAPQSGIVIYSGAYGGYGNVVVLQHSGDLYTLYGHNSYLLVKYGDRINAGQVISMVGSTGRSTGPHLHFEVRQGNGYVNPLDYLGYLQKSGAYLESSNTGVHYLPPARSDKQTARAQVPAKRKKKSTWSVELIKGSDVEMVEF